MKKKEKPKKFKKILYIEDGSVFDSDIDMLTYNNPGICVIKYRQGSLAPIMVDIKNNKIV